MGVRAHHCAPTTKLFINNKMVESQTNDWIDLHNPATNEVRPDKTLVSVQLLNTGNVLFILKGDHSSTQSNPGWNGSSCRSSKISLSYMVQNIYSDSSASHVPLSTYHQEQYGKLPEIFTSSLHNSIPLLIATAERNCQEHYSGTRKNFSRCRRGCSERTT